MSNSTSDGIQLIHLFTLGNVLLNRNEKEKKLKKGKQKKTFNTLYTEKFANDVILETRGTEALSYTPKDQMRESENELRITRERDKRRPFQYIAQYYYTLMHT